jgi:hypothetical protein
VERTSYAERDEVKGFLELVLTPGASARGRLRFHPLPTRPLPAPLSRPGWRWPR